MLPRIINVRRQPYQDTLLAIVIALQTIERNRFKIISGVLSWKQICFLIVDFASFDLFDFIILRPECGVDKVNLADMLEVCAFSYTHAGQYASLTIYGTERYGTLSLTRCRGKVVVITTLNLSGLLVWCYQLRKRFSAAS